jgi:nuclear pore complex protein Nup133
MLGQRWAEMKPKIIRPLGKSDEVREEGSDRTTVVGIDQVDRAYELAEHHRDFPTLVYLCHDAVAGSGQARVQRYIEIFGEEFAFVLYQWYIDQGQSVRPSCPRLLTQSAGLVHALLSQDEVYGHLLTKFFAENGYPEMAWMHHLACKRYGEAAGALVSVEQATTALSQKHVSHLCSCGMSADGGVESADWWYR